MLEEDKNQYCWVTPDGIGGPEDSVEQAVKSYLELHRPDNLQKILQYVREITRGEPCNEIYVKANVLINRK